MTFLNSVSSNVTSYTDVTPPTGIVYYLIEVVKPTACNPSYKTVNGFSSIVSNVASSDESGIAEISSADDIQIYPNPGNGVFTVTLKGNVNNADIEIVNSLGQIIYTDLLNSNKQTIDISAFSKGIYFMKLNFTDHTYFKKLVLQ
jgi:hypothetical protein